MASGRRPDSKQAPPSWMICVLREADLVRACVDAVRAAAEYSQYPISDQLSAADFLPIVIVVLTPSQRLDSIRQCAG